MMRRTTALAWVALGALCAGPGVGGDETTEWTLKSALKQIDNATKDLHGVRAKVEWDEIIAGKSAGGSATLAMRADGFMRGEVAGGLPRTILALPPYVYVYRPSDATADLYSTLGHPEVLLQYVAIGFATRGNDMKKDWNVQLVGDDKLDGRPILFFTLTPKAKDAKKVISAVQLWIDQETWLPAKLLIQPTEASFRIQIRYLDTTLVDELPDFLFRPSWPKETRVVNK